MAQKAGNKTNPEARNVLPHTVQGSKFKNFAKSFYPLFAKCLDKAHEKLQVKKMLFRQPYSNLKVEGTRWDIRYVTYIGKCKPSVNRILQQSLHYRLCIMNEHTSQCRLLFKVHTTGIHDKLLHYIM